MAAASYRFNAFRLVTATRELWKDGTRVPVPPRVFTCLCHLIEHRDRAVGREELIFVVWRRDNVSDIQLGQLVLRARRAVDDEGGRQHSIRTAVGFGYHWVAPTEVDGPVDATPPRVIDSTEGISTSPDLDDATPLDDGKAVEIAAGGDTPRRDWRPSAASLLLSLAAGIAMMVAAFSWLGLHKPAASPGSVPITHAAVLPLTIPADADAAWARLGGMDLVADRLRRSGLAVAPSESVLGFLKSDPAVAPEALRTRLERTLDASLVIEGAITREAGVWQVHLDERTPAATQVSVDGRDADLLRALNAAADRLLGALGRSPEVDSDVDTPGVAAIAQRVRAALLADDPVTARDLLDHAPAPLRDDRELEFLRAQTDARAGRFDDADGAFTRLLATLSATDNPRLSMRALSARGLARIRIGRIAEARADFDAALVVPGAELRTAEFALASNSRGIAEVLLHDLDGAARDFGTARVHMERSGDVLGVARVDVNLGLLEYERGALAEAKSHLLAAASRFEPLGAIRESASAWSGLQLVQLALLDDRGALATSERLAAQASHAGDPAQQRGLRIRRATALLANGFLRDARRILDDLIATPGADFHETRDDERVYSLRVELALREGRSDEAARDARELPDAPRPDGDDDLRAMAALLRQRTLGAAATTAFASTAETSAPTLPARILRELAEAEAQVLAGRSADADPLYRHALSLAEQTGVPRAIVTVAASYVPVLLAQGRMADAGALVGRTSVWADDDFDCALLQLRFAHAAGHDDAWRQALEKARALAHELPIPAALIDPVTPHPR
jgi:DNA-binding winged helix-turn-helix (wHTH) protein/tetratricopeptide (TPR) repeat protein